MHRHVREGTRAHAPHARRLRLFECALAVSPLENCLVTEGEGGEGGGGLRLVEVGAKREIIQPRCVSNLGKRVNTDSLAVIRFVGKGGEEKGGEGRRKGRGGFRGAN